MATRESTIQRIELRTGLVERGADPARLPVLVMLGHGITGEIAGAIESERLLELAGTYGLQGVGEPAEYDFLRVVLPDRTVEITVHNMGITLFSSDNELLRRIFRVLNVLKKAGGGLAGASPIPHARAEPQPKVGRNEPCPCGSGKKFKKCCLGEEPAAQARGPASAAIADIQDEFKGMRFESLEEANNAAREITARRNSAPLEEFSGLSPEQMFRFMHFPFESPNLVTFAESFTAPREAPVMMLFTILADALGTEGLRATAKGNLPRDLCKAAHREFLRVSPHDSFSASPYFKLSRETDFFELHLVRLVAGHAGLLRSQRGRFLLTAKGREAAEDTTGCRAFTALFRTFALKFNWAFFDRYPPYGIIQTAFLYSLYTLSRQGGDFRPAEFYGELFLRAFPAVLDEVPPNACCGPREHVMRCHGLRTFTRLAVLFDLAESRSIAGGGLIDRIEVRKTPVLDAFVRFASSRVPR